MSNNKPATAANDKMDFQDSGHRPTEKTGGRWKLFVCLIVVLTLLVLALIIAVAVLSTDLENEKERSSNLASLLQGNSSPTPTDHRPPPTTRKPITDDVFLPKDVFPYLYEIELKPNIYDGPSSDFTFDGVVKIYITCRVETNSVTLHTRDLTLKDDSIVFEQHGSKLEGHSPSFVSYTRDNVREFMIFALSESMREGLNYTLSMEYSGPLRHDAVGLYWGEYKENNITRYTVSTQLEPEFSRKTFPCFDEPSLKAQFDVRLVRKPSYMSLSNMKRAETTTRSDGYEVDVYKRTIRMSTYLLAFLFCDYQHLEAQTSRGVLVRTWSRKDFYTKSAFALDIVVKTIEAFEDYFEVNYSLEKSDNVALPFFEYFSAMENWGLVKYRESRMLYDPSVDTSSRKYSIAALVQHEIAHMWFGNIVTCSWWSDVWLHEAFASYLEVTAHMKIHPEWKPYDLLMVEFQRAMDLDDFPSSRSMVADVWKYPGQMFASITYDKGTAIVRQIHFILGEETFRKGLKRYLLANAFGNARTEDLWTALQEQLTEDKRTEQIGDIMDTWLRQNNYPVVKVSREEDGTLTLTQQRFIKNKTLLQNSKSESSYGYRWTIPFTFTSNTEQNFNQNYEDIIWINYTDTSTVVRNTNGRIPPKSNKDSWVIGNVGVTGFYRMMYDSDTWAAIAKQLQNNHEAIDTKNRAQLINDVWAFSKADMLDIEKALDITDYLRNDNEYIPWFSAYNELVQVEQMLRFTVHFGVYQKYMISIVKPVLTKLGTSNAQSNLTERYLRTLLITMSCLYGDDYCVNAMNELFQRWKDSGESIDPDLRQAVYCTAVANLGEPAWNFIFESYKDTNNTDERGRLRYGLSCSNQLWLIRRFVDLIINTNSLPEEDEENALIDLCRNPIGKAVVLENVFQKWQFLKEDKPKFSLLQVILRIAESFNSEMDKTYVSNLLEKEADDGNLRISLLRTLKKIDTGITWMDKFADKIATWMKNKTSHI